MYLYFIVNRLRVAHRGFQKVLEVAGQKKMRIEKVIEAVENRENDLLKAFLKSCISSDRKILFIRFCEAEKLLRENLLPIETIEELQTACWAAIKEDDSEASSLEAQSFWGSFRNFSFKHTSHEKIEDDFHPEDSEIWGAAGF